MAKWLILIGVVLLICIIEWIREINTFKITHYDITSEKLNGLGKECKVLFLTDLHSNSYGKGNERLLDAVRQQTPDLILIGGDMLVGKKNAGSDIAEALVCELVKICPVYYANGNHEQRMKAYPDVYGTGYELYSAYLKAKGVRLLENEKEDLQWENIGLSIYGLEIPMQSYHKFQKVSFTEKQMKKCLGEIDSSKYNVLLAHNPTFMNTYLEWGADLILSGHLHGGVVRIPGLGGVITPQFRLFPKYSGEKTVVGETSIVVSKGLGVHTVKIRFLNPAELVVLHLCGNDK